MTVRILMNPINYLKMHILLINMGEKNQSQDKITTLVIGQSGQVDPKLPHSRFESCPATGVTSDPKSTGNSNVFLSMLYAQSGIHPVWTPKLVCQKESSPFPTSTSSQSNPQSHGSERHDWSDDTTHASDQNLNDQSNMDCETHDSPAAGPSAASSFYHDSDGNATSAKVAKDNHKSFVDSDHRRYDGFIGTDSHRTSQREAALIKFRLKRKDRCYEKKVRYQSRKRLAEQRPRAKGQFVGQVHNDHPVLDAGDAS